MKSSKVGSRSNSSWAVWSSVKRWLNQGLYCPECFLRRSSNALIMDAADFSSTFPTASGPEIPLRSKICNTAQRKLSSVSAVKANSAFCVMNLTISERTVLLLPPICAAAAPVRYILKMAVKNSFQSSLKRSSPE